MKLIRLALGLPFLFAACNLNSSDEGKKEVTNFEDLPNCSSAGTTSGTSLLGESVYVEEEEVTYLCTERGWVVSRVAEFDALPTCPTRRGTNIGLKVYVDADSLTYLCVNTGWIKSDSTMEETEIPVPEVENVLLQGVASAIGPFVVGSVVSLREVSLDAKSDTLLLADSVQQGSVVAKAGDFSIPRVTTYTRYALVSVKGLFRDVLTGAVSEDSLELHALVDLSNSEFKVDVFTHLQFARAKVLINKGYTVPAALEQAEKDLLNAFGFDSDDKDAAELALALLLRADQDEAGFALAIKTLSEDIAKDGSWDDTEFKTQLADFAFNIENLKIKDEESGELLLKEADYRRNLEKFGVSAAPAFEAYFTKFWVADYGLGGCGPAREGAVVQNADESSDSSSAYYTCVSSAWRVATDFERDTVSLGNAVDGVLHVGNVNAQKVYVYDTTGFGTGETTRWVEADSITYVLDKACTDYDDVVYTVEKTTDKDDNDVYYGCFQRRWIPAGLYVAEIGYMCNPGAKNVVEKFKKDDNDMYARCKETKVELADGTVDTSYAWNPTDKANYELRDNDCELYEVVKSGSEYYYCADDDNVHYESASEDDAELGVCREDLDSAIKTYKKGETDVYRVCQKGADGKWSWVETNENTYKVGKVCNAGIIGTSETIGEDQYVCACQIKDSETELLQIVIDVGRCAGSTVTWFKR